VAVAALLSGRAYAIEEKRIFGGTGGIKLMIAGVDAEPVRAASIQLIEERHEPGLLFVKDADWFLERS